MKIRNICHFVLLVTVTISTFVSCNSDDSKNTVDDIADTVKEGSWRVSYLYDSGNDKTADYVEYNFIFGSNNVLTASTDTNSNIGQWFVVKSTSDADLYSTIFKISIGPNAIFQDLNRDWKVMDNTGSSLMLKDDSHGETAIDYLTFEKIPQ